MSVIAVVLQVVVIGIDDFIVGKVVLHVVVESKVGNVDSSNVVILQVVLVGMIDGLDIEIWVWGIVTEVVIGNNDIDFWKLEDWVILEVDSGIISVAFDNNEAIADDPFVTDIDCLWWIVVLHVEDGIVGTADVIKVVRQVVVVGILVHCDHCSEIFFVVSIIGLCVIVIKIGLLISVLKVDDVILSVIIVGTVISVLIWSINSSGNIDVFSIIDFETWIVVLQVVVDSITSVYKTVVLQVVVVGIEIDDEWKIPSLYVLCESADCGKIVELKISSDLLLLDVIGVEIDIGAIEETLAWIVVLQVVLLGSYEESVIL